MKRLTYKAFDTEWELAKFINENNLANSVKSIIFRDRIGYIVFYTEYVE